MDPIGWGFPFTVNPALVRATDNVALASANDGIYLRVLGGGTISKIGLKVATSSGNISVAAYRNSGVGRAAVPGTTRLATSGAVACPATGYQEVSLGATIDVVSGDWFFLSADNNTATFAALVANGGASNIAAGACYLQATAHPAPSSPGTLSAYMGRAYILVGVA